MRGVSVAGIGWIPVLKENPLDLRRMAEAAAKSAIADANVEMIDALYASNMLGSDLQNQKHIGAMIADSIGRSGIEALQIDATSASGAAALRAAYLSIASGQADFALAVGVEKMVSTDSATTALARGLDQETESNETMVTINAKLMQRYLDKYSKGQNAKGSLEKLLEGFAHFSVNSHANGEKNPDALFQKRLTLESAVSSRVIHSPLRLSDCSPICDGAAAVVLTSDKLAESFCESPVRVLASSVSTDRFSVASRVDPLLLSASQYSADKAYRAAQLSPSDISFFEVHDAFSIMAVLSLEACGFMPRGEGWRAGIEGDIYPDGRLPLSTFGGLKSRGHPVGATALYQVCEIVRQIRGAANNNQLKKQGPLRAMMQSIGGAGTTILTHLFSA